MNPDRRDHITGGTAWLADGGVRSLARVSDLAWHDFGGPGRPFVLVHGFTGSSDDFAYVVRPLTDLRRVFIVDHLGHGASPRRFDYNLRMLTDSLVEFLDDIIGEPADLLGHSMGGRVLLPIAVERPQHARSLVLMDTWADPPDRESHSLHLLDLFNQGDELAMEAWRHHIEPPSPEESLIEELWGPDWVREHHDRMSQVDPLAVVHLGREVFGERLSLLRDITEIRCPTTVLVGEFDRPFIGPSERLASHIPDARLVVIDGAYHSPQLTHPRDWLIAVAAHLRWVDRMGA